MIVAFAKRWSEKVFRSAEPQEHYETVCPRHGGLENKVDNLMAGQDRLEEGQVRIEKKVDQILLSYLPRRSD